MAIFKNKFLLVFIVLASFFCITKNVNAYTAVGDDCTESGDCLLVCNYINYQHTYDGNNGRNISIYYYYENAYWQIKWQTTTTEIITKETKKNNFRDTFSNNIYLTTDVSQEAFSCPNYGYLDLSDLNSDNEICFDNDGKTCADNYSNIGTAFGISKDKFISSSKDYDLFTNVDKYFNEWVLGDISCEELTSNVNQINNGSYFAEKVSKDFSVNFLKNNKTPIFLKNTIENGMETMSLKFQNDLKKKMMTCDSEIDENLQSGKINSVTANNQKEELNKIDVNTAMQDFKGYLEEISKSNTDIIEYETFDCEGILGDPTDDQKPAYWIQFLLDIMKYIAIAALIALSAIDFFKAIISNDKDSLKKAGKTTGLRFIYCVILFFLPVLVNFVMSLLGLYDTCGIG